MLPGALAGGGGRHPPWHPLLTVGAEDSEFGPGGLHCAITAGALSSC